jgi:hypothetical protein
MNQLLVTARIAALSLAVSSTGVAATNCRSVEWGFPYSIVEVGPEPAHDTHQPSSPLSEKGEGGVWDALQHIQGQRPPPRATQQLPRIAFRLAVTDDRCGLGELGYHATAVLRCPSLDEKGAVAGLVHLGAAEPEKAGQSELSLKTGKRAVNGMRWPYAWVDDLEVMWFWSGISIGRLSGVALHEAAYVKGERSHDRISIAVDGDCAGLSIEIEMSPRSSDEARKIVSIVSDILNVRQLTAAENEEEIRRKSDDHFRRLREKRLQQVPDAGQRK